MNRKKRKKKKKSFVAHRLRTAAAGKSGGGFFLSCRVMSYSVERRNRNRTEPGIGLSSLVSSRLSHRDKRAAPDDLPVCIRPVRSQYKLVLNVTRVNLLPNCCLFAACCSLGAVPSARRTSTAMAAGAGLTPSILSNLHYSRLFVHTGSECELASSATGRRLSAAP